MMNIAHTTEERAALAFGTVKNRIRMCGRPGRAEHEREAERDGVDRRGQERARAERERRSAPPCCSSARLNSSIGLPPTLASTKIDITTMPVISSTALMICTHVVATMPPKTT